MPFIRLLPRAIVLGPPVAMACCAYAQQPFPNTPLRIITPNAAGGSSDFLLALHPAVPAASLQELISAAKTRPGQLKQEGQHPPRLAL